jgi:hypothetical protein
LSTKVDVVDSADSVIHIQYHRVETRKRFGQPQEAGSSVAPEARGAKIMIRFRRQDRLQPRPVAAKGSLAESPRVQSARMKSLSDCDTEQGLESGSVRREKNGVKQGDNSATHW